MLYYRSLRNNRTNSKKKSKDGEEEDKKEEKQEVVIEKEVELTPMEILVKAAKIMNPRQFELPREMKVPFNFPGTEKGNINSYKKESYYLWLRPLFTMLKI